MGEERAPARGLEAQRGAEPFGLDGFETKALARRAIAESAGLV